MGAVHPQLRDDGFSMDGVWVGVVGSQNLLNLGNSSVVVHPQLR